MGGTDESSGSVFGYIELEAGVARGQATTQATTSAAFPQPPKTSPRHRVLGEKSFRKSP